MKTYTYEEAKNDSIEYFNGDELAATVFLDKYALKNEAGEILENTPVKMHQRLAKEFARIEKNKFKNPYTEEDIFLFFNKFEKIVPQGSPMFGIGNKSQIISLSNCYVVPPPLDSYGSICQTDEILVQISKRRGGVGTDISNLRPRGMSTKNAAKSSTGSVTFADRYSNSIREVGQEGRRGALMITMSVHHPDVEEFMRVKVNRKKITGANISIKLTNEFLNAVKEDKEYEQRWPIDSKSPKISKMVNAKEIWDKIINYAHEMAEPGILFWDNIIKESPADCYSEEGFETLSTNPCGEIPLSKWDSCRLLCLNLFGFVKNPFQKDSYFDFEEFFQYSKIAQRLMDDLVDLEIECLDGIIKKIKSDPEPKDIKNIELKLWENIKKTCITGRRTGTGTVSLGDTLAALGLKYASKESEDIIDKIYQTLKLGSYKSSVDMAKQLGPFSIWDYNKEKNNPFIQRVIKESNETDFYNDFESDYKKYGRRNISNLTSAPTGSVSILTQTTSGIEPLFLPYHIRRKKINPNDKESRIDFVDQNGDSWQNFTVLHPKFKYWIKCNHSEEETKKIYEDETKLNEEFKKSPWYGCCAEDLDWGKRVEVQSLIQKHIDHSISSTVNVPEDIPVEKVSEIYKRAWDTGCKGITIYRKNCRTGVLIDSKKESKNDALKIFLNKTHAPKRPKELPCEIHHTSFKYMRYYVVVGLLEGQPYEVFTGINHDNDGEIVIPKKILEGNVIKKSRGEYYLLHYNSNGEEEKYHLTNGHTDDTVDAMTRMISCSLRHGADISFIVHQLEKTKGDLKSFSKVLSRTLKKYINDGTKVHGASCPSCKSPNLERNSGCITCKDCGWSGCS